MRYRALVSLLYGQFNWITRHPGGSLTVPTGLFCRALGTRSSKLRPALEALKALGLLDSLAWHGRWFVVRPAVPVDMARDLGDVLNVGT